MRSLASQEAWLKEQTCLNIHIAGARSVSENTATIIKEYLSMNKPPKVIKNLLLTRNDA